jgi:hypothetical protein
MQKLRKNRTRILEPKFASFAGIGNVTVDAQFLELQSMTLLNSWFICANLFGFV